MVREGVGGKLRSPAVYMECLRCQLFKGKLRKEWNRRATVTIKLCAILKTDFIDIENRMVVARCKRRGKWGGLG